MTQPTPWNKTHDFTQELDNDHGAALDEEFDDGRLTVSQLRYNLGLIQRDDGALRNQIVSPDSLSGTTLALIAGGVPAQEATEAAIAAAADSAASAASAEASATASETASVESSGFSDSSYGYAADAAASAIAASVSAASSQASAQNSALSATSAAAYAAAATLSSGVYATTAKALSNGVSSINSLVGGSGGTDGSFALAFTGGAGTGAAGTFTVAGGAVVATNLTYSGDSYTSAPTPDFSACPGLTGASATAVISINAPAGSYFSVPIVGTTDFMTLYQNVSGVATSITKYPSAAFVNSLSFFPGQATAAAAELAAFGRVKKFELYGADPAKYYSVKYLFWKDAGTRFNFTIQRSNDNSGTGATDVCVYSLGSGADVWTSQREITLAATGGSGITGVAILDFTDPTALSVNVAPASAPVFQRREISSRVVATSAARTADVNASISAALAAADAATSGLRIPFSDDMANTVIRGAVKSLYLYGTDPTHTYIISQFNIEEFPGTPLTRALFDIKDLTTATIVARYSLNLSSAPGLPTFLASLPSIVKLTDLTLGSPTRVYAVMTLDKTKITAFTINAPTTTAGGGIHASRCFSAEAIADYLDRDYWQETIRVGAGQTYTTLRAAVESLYISTSPLNTECNRSSYHNRILIDLVDDGTYNATLLTIPAYVEVRGNGVGRTFIQKENNNHDAMLEAHLDTKFRDCTILSDTGDGGAWSGEYCVHSDQVNLFSKGDKAQNRWLKQSFKRMELIGGSLHAAQLFGCGISSGQEIRFDDVVATHLGVGGSNSAAFGFHNTGPTISTPGIYASVKPALVDMRGCRSADQTLIGVYLQTLEPGPKNHLTLHDCDFYLIRADVASGGEVITDKVGDRNCWRIGGVHAGPVLQTDPDGALVLATTAGVAVSGTASIIFGTVDELGRGDAWIKTGTSKSIGARLGDCSSVNKTLTIGAQSYVFNTDVTGSSNATLIAAINGAITTNPVSEVDVVYEAYPDMGFSRRMLNSSGATIPKGRFVKRTGTNTIDVAAPGDKIYGWVYRAILNGNRGSVVITKNIAMQYIEAATSSTGEWGLAAGGLLSFAAATKLGSVWGGIVTIW